LNSPKSELAGLAVEAEDFGLGLGGLHSGAAFRARLFAAADGTADCALSAEAAAVLAAGAAGSFGAGEGAGATFSTATVAVGAAVEAPPPTAARGASAARSLEILWSATKITITTTDPARTATTTRPANG
jgi:hypothetical protein